MRTKHAITIDADVRDVLERSTMTGDSLTLPQQLDRALYEKVAKVITAAGGKWHRGKKSHLFTRDPRVALGLALEAGAIVDTKKALNQFFTPADLAVTVVQAAKVRHGHQVLEPSAGGGALATAADAAGGRVQCIEIDTNLAIALQQQGFQVLAADFLQIPAVPMFDAVVMNPPFDTGQDVKHITHACAFLRPGGRLVAIAGAGVSFRQDAATRAFRDYVELHGTMAPLPDGSFRDSGTDVRTVLITLTL